MPSRAVLCSAAAVPAALSVALCCTEALRAALSRIALLQTVLPHADAGVLQDTLTEAVQSYARIVMVAMVAADEQLLQATT